MSKTNCINCGAAKDTTEIKCPFCGTTYLDFTAIDFTSKEPVVCEFVMPHFKERVILRMLAQQQFESFNVESETCSVYSGWGKAKLATITTGIDANIGISFKPVIKQDDKTMFTLTADK